MESQSVPFTHGFAPATGHVLVPQSPAGHVTSHLHELTQSIVPHAALPPVQVASSAPVPPMMLPHAPEPTHVTVAEPPSVVMSPHAALPPLHEIPQAPAPHVMPRHAEPPLHVALPPPVPSEMLPQLALPRQLTSHLPPVQLMFPHASVVPLPSHVMLQVPTAHVTLLHAPTLPHVSLHDSDCVQLTSWHAPWVAQPITQFQPAGQVMLPLPVPVMLQVFVWKLHSVPGHTDGQIAASIGASGPASLNVPTMQ